MKKFKEVVYDKVSFTVLVILAVLVGFWDWVRGVDSEWTTFRER